MRRRDAGACDGRGHAGPAAVASALVRLAPSGTAYGQPRRTEAVACSAGGSFAALGGQMCGQWLCLRCGAVRIVVLAWVWCGSQIIVCVSHGRQDIPEG